MSTLLLLFFSCLAIVAAFPERHAKHNRSSFSHALIRCSGFYDDDEKSLIVVDSSYDPSFKICVYSPIDDIYVSKSILLNEGLHALKDLELLHKTLGDPLPDGKKKIVVDVGANIGVFSNFFGRLGYEVMSYEPVIGNYRKLALSACINYHMYGTNIVSKNLAVSNVVGNSVEMIITSYNRGHSAVASKTTVENFFILEKLKDQFKTQTRKVLTTTIDSELSNLCSRNIRVDLFKIDVEGYEGFVIAGSKSILSKCPPKFIFIEILKTWIDGHGFEMDTLQIFLLLKSMNYSLIMATNNRIKNLDFWKSEEGIKDYVKNIKSDQWDDYLLQSNV